MVSSYKFEKIKVKYNENSSNFIFNRDIWKFSIGAGLSGAKQRKTRSNG